MYVFREVMYCKPGKVRDMVSKFQRLSTAVERLGFRPFQLYTDVSGERFWTVVAETRSESLNAFFDMEARVMADPEAGQAMAGYHELIEQGRREIYKVVE